MNRKSSIIVGGLALALSASVALAQAPAGSGNPPPPPPRGGPDGLGGFDGHRGGPGGHHRGPGRWMAGRFARLTPEERAKRQADAFARMDANKDGRVTFEEFRADLERRKLEREQAMFKRFSGGQDFVTLDQLKARDAERERDHGRRGDRGPRGPGGPGRGGPDQGPPPAR